MQVAKSAKLGTNTECYIFFMDYHPYKTELVLIAKIYHAQKASSIRVIIIQLNCQYNLHLLI